TVNLRDTGRLWLLLSGVEKIRSYFGGSEMIVGRLAASMKPTMSKTGSVSPMISTKLSLMNFFTAINHPYPYQNVRACGKYCRMLFHTFIGIALLPINV